MAPRSKRKEALKKLKDEYLSEELILKKTSFVNKNGEIWYFNELKLVYVCNIVSDIHIGLLYYVS